VRLGVLDAAERGRLMDAVEDMRKLPLWIDKGSRTAKEIHAKVRRARIKHDVGLVCVDYLQLMNGEGENENVRVGNNSRELKLSAEEYELPYLVLSQLSRPAKGTNPEPGLTDLRASGSLEQDADVAMFLHAADGKLGSGPRRLIVAKQRCGPVDSFPVMFDGTRQLFSEITEGGE
jgi:replicative DNA helicase